MLPHFLLYPSSLLHSAFTQTTVVRNILTDADLADGKESLPSVLQGEGLCNWLGSNTEGHSILQYEVKATEERK